MKKKFQKPVNCLIVTGIFPPDIGGPASYLPKICPSLKNSEITIQKIVTLSNEKNFSFDQKFPMPIIRIRRSIFFPIRVLKTILTLLKHGYHCDLAYVHGLYFEAYIALKLILRKKLVAKIVGDLIWEKARNSNAIQDNIDDFQRKKYNFKWEALKQLQSFYLKKYDRILTPSYYLKTIVNAWGIDNDKIYVVYNAVKLLTGNNRTTEKKYDMVTICRLIKHKRIDEIIKYAAQLNLSYLIIGDGPEESNLKQLARSLKATVSFVGRKNQDEIYDLLKYCKSFVLNSEYEGLPHVLLEAGLSRLLIIAPAIGGIPEVIINEKTGLLFDPKNNTALLTHMKKIHNQKLTEPLIENSYEYISKKFNFSNMVKETRAVLLFT